MRITARQISIAFASARFAALVGLVAVPAMVANANAHEYITGVQLGGGKNYIQREYDLERERIARLPYRKLETRQLENPFARKSHQKRRWVWVRGETGYIERHYID